MPILFSGQNDQKQALWAFIFLFFYFFKESFQHYMLINQWFSRLDLRSFLPPPLHTFHFIIDFDFVQSGGNV